MNNKLNKIKILILDSRVKINYNTRISAIYPIYLKFSKQFGVPILNLNFIIIIIMLCFA